MYILQVLYSVGKRDRLYLWDGILFRRLRRNQIVLQRAYPFLLLSEWLLGEQFLGKFGSDRVQDLFLRCCFGNLLQSPGAHPQLQLSRRISGIQLFVLSSSDRDNFQSLLLRCCFRHLLLLPYQDLL